MSDNRLKLVKSGIALNKLAPEKDGKYFVPELESYFSGADRILRKTKKVEEIEKVKFFITEADPRKPLTS